MLIDKAVKDEINLSSTHHFLAQFEAKRHWVMLLRDVAQSSLLTSGFSYLHLKRYETGRLLS